MSDEQSGSPRALFSSPRERRLWMWTLAVVVAIYSTLGLASTVARTLPDDLAAVVFLLGMFVVALTVLTQGLEVRLRGIEVAAVLGISIAYLFVFFRMTLAERSHLIEYGVVAIFIYEALTERASQGRRVPVPFLLAILMASLVGVLDEGIQAFLPKRVFDPTDMLFNFLASLMAVCASAALRLVRRLALGRT